MCYLYAIPSWFAGFDVALEVIFVVVALFIAIFSASVYRLVSIRTVQLLAIAFGGLSVAYLVQAVHNTILFVGNYATKCPPVSFLDAFSLTAVVTLIFVFLAMGGLILLVFLTEKTRSLKLFWLLLIVSIVAVVANRNMVLMFYLLGTVYLIVISSHFLALWQKKRRVPTLLAALAFIVLCFSYVQFLVALTIPAFYVLAHIFELLAFILILASIIVIKNGQKKR